MTARRGPRDIEPIGIAAEARRVLVNPSDGALYLVGHDHQVSIDFRRVVEIERNEMRAGIDESLGHVGCALCVAATPSAAVDKDVDRCIGLLGYIDVELLDLGRAVGDATGRAKAGQRGGALLRVTLGD